MDEKEKEAERLRKLAADKRKIGLTEDGTLAAFGFPDHAAHEAARLDKEDK
jgi:hypothetical protein